jgi:heme/copper-type cytochrome/quinol oxidase subunit 4
VVFFELYWDSQKNEFIDHHTIFNTIILILVILALLIWVKKNDKDEVYAEN